MKELLKYCTNDTQTRVVKAAIKYEKKMDAAKAAGVSDRSFRRLMQQVRANKAKGETNVSGVQIKMPEGFGIKRVSKYFKDGENTAGWVIGEPDKEVQKELMERAIEALSSEMPKYPAIKGPELVIDDLVNLITLTDTHIGMYATSSDDLGKWDLERSADTLWKVYKSLIDGSPNAHTCVISALGDLLHCNGGKPVTPRSGHILDVDGEFDGALDVTILTLRRIISYALEKHERVILSVVRGNHDEDQAAWLRKFIEAVYENEPRLEVLGGNYTFSCFQKGNIMLGWYHGDFKKLESLPLYFATHYPKEWGTSLYREVHTGDKHHHKEFDVSGVIVKQHPTLIPKDSYAKSHGYNSLRFAERITYNINTGRCSSGTVSPEMVM